MTSQIISEIEPRRCRQVLLVAPFCGWHLHGAHGKNMTKDTMRNVSFGGVGWGGILPKLVSDLMEIHRCYRFYIYFCQVNFSEWLVVGWWGWRFPIVEPLPPPRTKGVCLEASEAPTLTTITLHWSLGLGVIRGLNSHYFHIIGDGKLNPSP